ncbi:MAG: PD40 domain-containing protein [Candidatus Zixiibacteriota bacterium]|nr:MAG: PD40 domain-containing protein [candidate division Zixibacteria bacterium]
MNFRRSYLIILIFLIAEIATAQNVFFGQNKVQYRDFDWYFIQTADFDIYFYKNEDTLAVFAANVLNDAYKEIKNELNYILSDRVPVIIYASHNEFQQTNVISELIPEGVGGFTEVFKNRIVVPFTGSYEDFRHVLHHELSHAVVFDFLYGNALKSIFSREALFQPPDWFREGYAEYSSRQGWDIEADMYVRDAIIEGYMPPLQFLSGFLAYKSGQSALVYITEKYGEEKIFEILSKGRSVITMEKAVKATLGLSLEDLSEEWQKTLKKTYWPEIADRDDPNEIGEMLTDHRKDGSVYNQQPEWSPSGDRLAFFSDRSNPKNGYSDRFNEIFIISTIDGEIISRLVKAERSGDMESLHSYVSGLTWSPDGKFIAFIGKSHGKDALFIYNASRGKKKKKMELGLSGMRNPAWSPEGNRIAFEGFKNGFTDLYIYDLVTKETTRLMSDKDDDNSPSWSPDGKNLAFSSDRPVGDDKTGEFKYGNYNIFVYNLETDEIKHVTDNPYNNTQPACSPDGKRIAFVSNRNGINNIYLHEIETGVTFPVSDVVSGLFSPTWSPSGDKIAVSAFNKYGYDILILKDLKNIAPDDGELALTPYMRKLRNNEKNIFVPEIQLTREQLDKIAIDSTSDLTSDFDTYVFRAGENLIKKDLAERDPETPDDGASEIAKVMEPDTLEYLLPSGEYKLNKYKLKFSPELITGGFSYDNFYGLQGQSFLSISDIFGNHHFYIVTDLVNTIDQSNVLLSYAYTERRIDYAAGIFHFKDTYFNNYERYYFSDRVFGTQGYASYPFSRFSRFDITLTQMTVSRDNFSLKPDRTTNLLSLSGEFVNDAVIWGIVGPVSGQRYKLEFEKSIKTVSTGLSYLSAQGDFRKYWHFWDRYNLALRIGGGGSSGRDAKSFYLGGSSNWIGPKREQADIYGIDDIYINELIVPLRGYSYFEESGTHYGIANLEFRYPFIEYFQLRFPLPISLQQVSGAIFWDMGAAWNDRKKVRFFDKDKGFPVLGNVNAGLGIGARANLGIFVLRVDLAWATDLDSIADKPETYFSFGAEF